MKLKLEMYWSIALEHNENVIWNEEFMQLTVQKWGQLTVLVGRQQLTIHLLFYDIQSQYTWYIYSEMETTNDIKTKSAYH